MNMRRNYLPSLSVMVILACASLASAADFVTPSDLKRLDLQQFWNLKLPLEGGESVARLALVEDTLYALTNHNRALSVHSATGVIRWSNVVGEEGQTVRGPSHGSKYVFFTTPGSVRVFDRQSGELAGAPRVLRGVVIEVVSETATISIGEEHGVALGDVLKVHRGDEVGEKEGSALANLRITSVQSRTSRGHLERIATGEKPKPGDRVEADVMLPLREVKLPFAASSAAVSDNQRIYVGAANQRFYALEMVTGVERWQLLTPHTVSATPILLKDMLYIAGQDGQITSCTKEEKAKNWTFMTEAPIFADLVVTPNRVFAASTDRSLYCIDRQSGRRIWRERFDMPLNTAPIVAGNAVYQSAAEQGLFVLEAESGRPIWRRPEGGQFLAQFGDDAFLLASDGTRRLLRVSSKNGRKKEEADVSGVDYAVAGLANQSVFLGNSAGQLACLRPLSAPRLRVEQLQEALRSDRKMQLTAEMQAKEKAGAKKAPAEPKAKSIFEDDDGLASRSTATPVGGHGVLTPVAKPAPTTKAEEAKEAEGEKAEEGADKEGEEKAAEESGDEKAAEESGDDKAEGKEGESKDDEKAEEGDTSDDEKAEEGDSEDDSDKSDEDSDKADEKKEEKKPDKEKKDDD